MIRVIKAAALTSSALLAVAFISYRSGAFSGSISQASAPPASPAIPTASANAPAAPEQRMMLSDSKSSPIIAEATITTATQPTILLGGSKSKAILTPADAAKLNPPSAPSPPAIMSSSKYDVIINPTAPATQPTPPKAILSSSKVLIITDSAQLIPAIPPAAIMGTSKGGVILYPADVTKIQAASQPASTSPGNADPRVKLPASTRPDPDK